MAVTLALGVEPETATMAVMEAPLPTIIGEWLIVIRMLFTMLVKGKNSECK